MFVIATAGHVDHGKSTLVKALTGTDPDRWAEEKRRGLTIDLGFAEIEAESGSIGIVDVPGHERFISNMLAGVGSAPAVLFVIDALEGWKPQSYEHLAVLDLLGVCHGIVAVTKIDAAAASLVEQRCVEATAKLEGTSLGASPVLGVSAQTGEGIPELLKEIVAMGARLGEPSQGRPRINVDRSFSIGGAGTVITGTLDGGAVAAGGEVHVLPAGKTSRVRSIQAYSRSVKRAEPVSRVALNLPELDTSEIARGDVVVGQEPWMVTSRLEGTLRVVSGVLRLRSRAGYHLHAGTSETSMRMSLLGPQELGPRESCYVRMTLDQPVVAQPGDRFVVRDSGSRRVVAGGRILDVDPLRGNVASRVEALTEREGAANLADVILDQLEVCEPERLLARSGGLLASESVSLGPEVASLDWFSRACVRVAQILAAFHAENPLLPGMNLEELLSAIEQGDPKSEGDSLTARSDAGKDRDSESQRSRWNHVVRAASQVSLEGSIVSLQAHGVVLDPAQQESADALIAALRNSGLAPPERSQIVALHGEALLEQLIREGRVVSVGSVVFERSVFEEAVATIVDLVKQSPRTTSELRQALGTSRKFAIPILEYLDQRRLTRFDGTRRSAVAD